MNTVRPIATLVLTVALTAGTLPAGAATEEPVVGGPVPGLDEVTFDDYRALVDDLTASDVPRTTEVVDGQTLVTFSIDGFDFTLVDIDTPVGPTPDLGGGIDGAGWYITFNQTDQTALINGSGAALAAAICAIPGVGWVACAAAAAIVAAGAIYLNAYGRCPNNGHLKVYVQHQVAYCI